MLRTARLDDLPRLRDIERAAGAAFRELDMAAVANDEPPPVEALTSHVHDGCAWVVADASDSPVAYLIAHVVDGDGHIAQVSVHPRHAGQRLGAALIDRADGWAAANNLQALTLTTFAEVPWNRAYYERLGFRVLPHDQLGPELRRIREQEGELGLDRWPRVAMCRPVAPTVRARPHA